MQNKEVEDNDWRYKQHRNKFLISASTEQNSAGTQQVSTGTEEILTSMENFNSYSAKLEQLSLELQLEIQKFKF